jgi:hypothetical protein
LGDATGNIFLSGTSQIPLRDGLGDATGDALISSLSGRDSGPSLYP